MTGGAYNSRFPGRRQNRGLERTVIEVVQGPAEYPAGGFTTGVDTSAMRQLKRVEVAGMLDMISVLSGPPIGQSGAISASVISTGVSGNQVGIKCWHMFNQSGVMDTSGLTIIREVPADTDLSVYDMKVLCQGH